MPPCLTKHRLLETATDLFWRQSFSAVSVDEICKLAGVKKGSFYHFFQSKFDLIAAVYDKLWTDAKPELDALFAAHAALDARVSALCEHMYAKQQAKAEQYGQVLGCPFMTCASDLCVQDENFRKRSNALFEAFAAYFERLVEDAHAEGRCRHMTPREGGQMLFHYKMGVMFQARITNDLQLIQRELEAGFRRILELPAKPALSAAMLARTATANPITLPTRTDV